MSRKHPSLSSVPAAPTVQARRRPRRANLAVQNLRQYGTQWRSLTGIQKTEWAALGQRMAHLSASGGAAPLRAMQCFISVNTGRDAQNLPPLDDAPLAPDPVPFLTNVALSVTLDYKLPPGEKICQTPPTVTVTGTPAACAVQVMISHPTLGLSATPADSLFRVVGFIPDFSSGTADISAQFLSKYRLPSPGYRIYVRLVPLSPNGFRGQAVTISAIAAAA